MNKTSNQIHFPFNITRDQKINKTMSQMTYFIPKLLILNSCYIEVNAFSLSKCAFVNMPTQTYELAHGRPYDLEKTKMSRTFPVVTCRTAVYYTIIRIFAKLSCLNLDKFAKCNSYMRYLFG